MWITIYAAVIACAAGVCEVLLDVILFSAAFSSKTLKMLAALFGKIAVYGGFFYFIFALLRPGLIGAVVGFGAGFFPGLLVWFLLKGRTAFKGGKNG